MKTIVEELDQLNDLTLLEKRAFRFSLPTMPSANLAKGLPSMKMPSNVNKPLTSIRPNLGLNTDLAQRPRANSARFNSTMSTPQSAMGHQATRQVQAIPPAPPKPTV